MPTVIYEIPECYTDIKLARHNGNKETSISLHGSIHFRVIFIVTYDNRLNKR